MKYIALSLLLIFSYPVHAACEGSLREGSHTAYGQPEALSGALEDAREVCYPGQADPLEVACSPLVKQVNGKTVSMIQCVQTVSCTLCDDDLARRYEALD